MPRNDFYHEHVKEALRKDGWTITHDPYPILFAGMPMKIDLGAEKLIAQRGMRTIAVEIKNFRHSEANELSKTRGQLANYLDALAQRDPNRSLYLAIPKLTYQGLFSHTDVQAMVRKDRIRLIIFDPDTESIVEWKE